MRQRSFFTECNPVMAIVPVDLAAAANNGDWVSLKNYERVVILLIKGIGTAGQDPIFKLQQATDNAGTGVKDLLFTKVYSKVGTQTGITAMTKTTQAAATSYTDAVSAEAQAIIGVEITSEDLDSDGGFTHVRLDIADVGAAAQIGGALYLMLNPRHEADPVAESAIA